jgi:hypothetical protein
MLNFNSPVVLAALLFEVLSDNEFLLAALQALKHVCASHSCTKTMLTAECPVSIFDARMLK